MICLERSLYVKTTTVLFTIFLSLSLSFVLSHFSTLYYFNFLITPLFMFYLFEISNEKIEFYENYVVRKHALLRLLGIKPFKDLLILYKDASLVYIDGRSHHFLIKCNNNKISIRNIYSNYLQVLEYLSGKLDESQYGEYEKKVLNDLLIRKTNIFILFIKIFIFPMLSIISFISIYILFSEILNRNEAIFIIIYTLCLLIIRIFLLFYLKDKGSKDYIEYQNVELIPQKVKFGRRIDITDKKELLEQFAGCPLGKFSTNEGQRYFLELNLFRSKANASFLFFSFLWFGYRKMYGYLFLFYFATLSIAILLRIMIGDIHLIVIYFPLIFGLLGSNLYLRHCLKYVNNYCLDKHGSFDSYCKKYGGTSILGVFVSLITGVLIFFIYFYIKNLFNL